MSDYEKVKEWRSKNKDKVAEQSRRYRAKHPEKIKAVKDRWLENNSDRHRQQSKESMKRLRVVNPDAVKRQRERYKAKQEAKLVLQAGRPRPDACELCGEKSKTVFDHCHLKGHFRGWLCDRCNRVLGSVNDNVILLQRMINYLTENKEKQNADINS